MSSCIISVSWTHTGKSNLADWQHITEADIFVYVLWYPKELTNWLWELLVETKLDLMDAAWRRVSSLKCVAIQSNCRSRPFVCSWCHWGPVFVHVLNILNFLPFLLSTSPLFLSEYWTLFIIDNDEQIDNKEASVCNTRRGYQRLQHNLA